MCLGGREGPWPAPQGLLAVSIPLSCRPEGPLCVAPSQAWQSAGGVGSPRDCAYHGYAVCASEAVALQAAPLTPSTGEVVGCAWADTYYVT